MATRNENETDGTRELTAKGHLIQYSVNLPNFAGTLPNHFDKSFTFNCDFSPTSWFLRVTFQETPDDGSVSCLVTVKRTDKIPIYMKAEFLMRVFTDPCANLPAKKFKMQRLTTGIEVRRTFDGFISQDVLRQLSDQELLFQVSFDVRGCHREDRRVVGRVRTEGHGAKALFSKM